MALALAEIGLIHRDLAFTHINGKLTLIETAISHTKESYLIIYVVEGSRVLRSKTR